MSELEYHSITTLNTIRDALPCKEGWEKLLAGLGKVKADHEPLPLLTVLDICGFDDALWVLSYGAPDCDRLARHYQAWCAEQVLPIFEAARPDDARVRQQIDMLRNDQASAAARSAAWDAARAAVRDAALDAARDAARSAARAAVRDAALDAARDAAQSAAWDVAWDAARDAAWDAAWDAQTRQLRKMLTQAKVDR